MKDRFDTDYQVGQDNLGDDASCLMLESVVLGRAAMGETVTRTTLRDTRRITRDGRPVLTEPLHLTTDALTAGPAVLDGARAFATLVLVAQGAEDAAPRARQELNDPGVTGAASGFDGKLVIRLMAGDGWPLRRQIARLVQALRPGPLPRVWQV
ncbi:MAG: urease accessory protein UreD [Desulfotignum sp.]